MKTKIRIPTNITIEINDKMTKAEIYELVKDIKESGTSCGGSNYSWDATPDINIKDTVKTIGEAINIQRFLDGRTRSKGQ